MLNQLSNLISVAIFLLNSSTLKSQDSDLYYYIKDRLAEINTKLMNHQ